MQSSRIILLNKLNARDPESYLKYRELKAVKINPIFAKVEGSVKKEELFNQIDT